MSTFLNGADVIIGKIYRGSDIKFKSGDIYKSGNNTYRFCELYGSRNGDTTLLYVDGMPLAGNVTAADAGLSAAGGFANSTAALGNFHGIACINDKGANCQLLKGDGKGPNVGIWAQIGGLLTNAKGSPVVPDATTADSVVGSLYTTGGGAGVPLKLTSEVTSTETRKIIGYNSLEQNGVFNRPFCAYSTVPLTYVGTGTNVGVTGQRATLATLGGYIAHDNTQLTTSETTIAMAVTGTTVAVQDSAGDIYGIIGKPNTPPTVSVAMSDFNELNSLAYTGTGTLVARAANDIYVTGLTVTELIQSGQTSVTFT